jgi:hypothetical protein
MPATSTPSSGRALFVKDEMEMDYRLLKPIHFAPWDMPDEEITRLAFRRHDPEPADVAIVDGRFGPRDLLEARVSWALELFRQGFVSQFITCGD